MRKKSFKKDGWTIVPGIGHYKGDINDGGMIYDAVPRMNWEEERAERKSRKCQCKPCDC